MSVIVVGAGNWGKNLVRTFAKLGALSGVIEASESLRLAVLSEHPDVHVSNDFNSALISDASAIAIATPAEHHYSMAKSALIAGKDVFVEKPMTLSSEEAEDLCRLAREHNRILMVGHLLLYQPAVQAMKNLIEDGAIGELISIHQERLNLGRARAVEDVLWSLGVHDVAVSQFLVGSGDCDAQAFGRASLNPGIADDVYLHCTYGTGVQTHLHCSWLWPERRRRTVAIGSRGMLVYDELAQSVTLHRKWINEKLENVEEESSLVYEGAGEPLFLELEHFLHCCETRETPKSDGESGLQVIRVLEQATAR
ncbi:MAG TPA: Gfo/Idh/MocA family oxidoreductase [Fimbriimonadaceae bacterium]|nr:Gfo/Idh/MocA family oxidoreductase [Fimbriimonadaceae bacterium]